MASIRSEEGGMVGCMVHRPPEGSGSGARAYFREGPDLGREGIDEAQALGDRVVGQILEECLHAAVHVRAGAVRPDGPGPPPRGQIPSLGGLRLQTKWQRSEIALRALVSLPSAVE